MKNEIAKAIKEIESAQNIGLMTHLNGDGDAFGSLLGLRNILEELGKKVFVFSNEPLLKEMAYLKNEIEYDPFENECPIDLLVMLDVGVEKRLTCPKIYKKAITDNKRTLIIDHHAEGDMYDAVSTLCRITEISSTAELVFWISQELGLRLDKITAELLLFGIETDTNFLKNPNTVNSTTYTAKSVLLKYGARVKRIKESVLEGSSLNNLKFLGTVINRALMSRDGVMATYITLDDLNEHGVDPGASSAISSFLDQTKGAKIVLVAEQRTPRGIKVSMRSNNSNANVAELAGFFGGGGHLKAAGFEIEGNLKEILNNKKL
jgi:phosphoesterase RecJ-like protein